MQVQRSKTAADRSTLPDVQVASHLVSCQRYNYRLSTALIAFNRSDELVLYHMRSSTAALDMTQVGLRYKLSPKY